MPTSPTKIIRKKNITLDDLAAMCMREFTLIHERFAKIDARFDSIEMRLESMENKMSTMDKVMATKENLVEMEVRMDRRFNRIETILTDHACRIERLEQAVELD